MASSTNPSTWSTVDVVEWLRKCNLEQYASSFQENEVDGSLLLDDGFDDNIIKGLIPVLKHRVLFNNERKKIKGVTVSPSVQIDNYDAVPETQVQSLNVDTYTTNLKATLGLSQPLPRLGSKAHCKWNSAERSSISLDTSHLIQSFNTIHTTLINRHTLSDEAQDLLSNLFKHIYASPEGNNEQFYACFNVLVDEPISSAVILRNIQQNRSLKPHVIDSLQRFHGLSDVMHSLLLCLDSSETELGSFVDIVDQITKYTLIVCTIESLSFDSQRFFSNLIFKNDLPVPLAYYTPNEFKINFNNLIEPLCFSRHRLMLLMGSPTSVGLGKTSLIPYIFQNKRSECLNIDGNQELRSGCIDTVLAEFKKSCSYAVFDVHGTMNVLNEDLITTIQVHSSIQVLCVTESDLHQGSFLADTLNYSSETRTKPTIIVIFDSNYNKKNYNSTSILGDFQKQFQNEQWQNAVFMTAPVLQSTAVNSSFNTVRRTQRLRQSFMDSFNTLQAKIEEQPQCESIFAIQAYYLATKSETNVCPSPVYRLQILSELDGLFGQLNDNTQNLSITTPVSYLDGAILNCEKQLSASWQEPPNSIQQQLMELRQEYDRIDRIPPYTDFFIKLITKRSYVELLLTEKYLQYWRAQYEPPLINRMTLAKKDAMTHLSCIKQLEAVGQDEISQKTEAERENIENQLLLLRNEFKSHEDLIHNIENQLANVDLTIGLFCDEILAVYEHCPKLFDSNNLFTLLTQKLSELMYKGFSFHILRGRPLRCHSKLMQESLRFLHQSTNKAPFVLTVIGEQSSAKSSLLNSTFGCNFRVSAGRCTIGMYMSVVRWHDYTIAIFDTEGLMSLEESGSIFDNQMVSMAMLSSHMVLVNHKGEFSSSLEHLIGMSFYAKLQIRSPLKPKLLFILRDQSDTTATGIFFRQLSKFKENLYNNSKFLKSSIDDELEINDQNVILLPNAFSSDTNTELGIEQTWRNRTFPMKILELRNMIFKNLTDANLEVYIDLANLYQRILCNWNAIDKLGPNLLACKTLYELSVMNELRDIANDIILNSVNMVNQEGQQRIDSVLASTRLEDQSNSDTDNLIGLFDVALQSIHQKNIKLAVVEFHSKTQRSCFPLELKQKVEKMIDPPIAHIQVLLRDEFGERLYKARRNARVSNAQRRLIDNVKSRFDQNMNLSIEELQVHIEEAYTAERETLNQTVRPEFETPDLITTKILNFYNSTLHSKTANIRHGNVYNLLPSFGIDQFRKRCRDFDDTWECMVKREPQETDTSHPLVRAFRRFLFGSPPDEYAEELWYYLKDKVIYWFNDPYNNYKNKKLLLPIFAELLPQLRADISKLVCERFQSSSDSRVITHVIELIENLLSANIIKQNLKHLNKCTLISDVALIALKTLINEAIKIEQHRHTLELEKARKELIDWRNSMQTQIQVMRDSFEQGKNMADIVINEIYDEVGRIILEKILHDVTADIIKSQFINHDAIQHQAYQESFVQANGENILKYVLDINRYFLELSLREINTSLVSIIHAQTLNAQQIILSIITKANSIVQATHQDNARSIANAIEQGISAQNLSVLPVDSKFALSKIISLPIQNIDNFKRGFKVILLKTNEVREKVDILTRDVEKNALAGCKLRLSRRLGCQSCCPGCGAKCSRSEPHEAEVFQPWYECKCGRHRCKCRKPEPILVNSHESAHHLAGAFHGIKYHKAHTPTLSLCYQNWKTSAMIIADDEEVFPIQKYYYQYHPEWYNSLNNQTVHGTACNEDLPPADQRRAWMIVRHVLVGHYSSSGMIDHPHYDPTLYPKVDSLPSDYKPKWNDSELK
ncbi:unnamed protein product [Adineta ricciae]|uniref:SAM domain-containing protein n=1 Tax=Adineta ricciae TaxID=249248 RepID=A0A814SX94_ADIRI|nr:unnamed protein product [Adineta ricciae]CAF1153761.1 unnamed protein product [Adineta ricciae]